jgi:hypothetical protein
MRIWIAAAALTLAACNTSTEGANGNVLFTPINCGVIAGCDFADSIGVYGAIDVQIEGVDGFATAGLDLASDDEGVFTVAPTEDSGGRSTWEIQAHSAGVARLAALTGDGAEVDFVEVSVQDVTHLAMEEFVGDAVGPTDETGFDEAWTVNADEQVSWFIRPRIAGDAPTMGRFSFETILDGGATWLDTAEQEESDRPNGYLFLQLPAGDYPISFELTESVDIYVDAIIHALPAN